MSKYGPIGNAHSNGVPKLPLNPELEISWAGPGRHEGEYCLGTSDGKIWFIAPHQQPIGYDFEVSKEAINGVAFIGSTYAISTRAAITIVEAPSSGPEGTGRIGHLPFGAHGVIASTHSGFVAPLGLNGLMNARPVAEGKHLVTVTQISNRSVYYYKVTGASSPNSGDTVVCALRQDGVVATRLTPNGFCTARTLTLPGLDVVDVCLLKNNSGAQPAVAIGHDSTLAMFRDVFHDDAPIAIQYEGLTGTSYRVFGVGDDIFVLTSHALYCLQDLKRLFVEGHSLQDRPITVLAKPMEAVDANLCNDQHLIVVLPDGVTMFDTRKRIVDTPLQTAVPSQESLRPSVVTLDWQVTEGLSLTTQQQALIAA